jgi:hypothetical protein
MKSTKNRPAIDALVMPVLKDRKQHTLQVDGITREEDADAGGRIKRNPNRRRC